MEPGANSNERKVIQAREILAKIERGEDVEYDGVIVEGDLDISELELPTEQVERKKVAESLGYRGRCKVISSEIAITNSLIRNNVNFNYAYFQKRISFVNTEFDGLAIFGVAKFAEPTEFARSKFCSDAIFKGTKFEGYADFFRVNFGEYTDFTRAEFGGIADFWGAEFGSKARFWEVEFVEDAGFQETEFRGDVTFMGAKFYKNILLDSSKFDTMYINFNSIKDRIVYDGPAYLRLIKNFKTIERFCDADDCYYQYRKKNQTRKKWYSEENRLIEFFVSYYNWTFAKIKRIFESLSWIHNYPPFTWIHRFNWSKLLDWIGFVSCGYGVRIQPIILWVLSSVLGFTLLYKLLPQRYGAIAESGPSTVTMEAVNNSTLLFTFSSGDGAISPSWGECLYFSFTALTGGTPDGLHPVGLCKYAVMFEGVLGYLFLALFVVVLARKIIR
jgi:hypothetical protein